MVPELSSLSPGQLSRSLERKEYEMKEFMLLIRNKGDHVSTMPDEQHQEFLQKCEIYIKNLKRQGKLIAAQPLLRQGILLSGSKNDWKETPFDATTDVQVGYYHILAGDLAEAINIAKGNPEFEYGNTASIEVRPIKMKEESTGFEYPKTP
jgi:hypothetical protein